MFPGGMPMNGSGGGGAGMPDLEQQGGDPDLMMAMMAGALPGGMGQACPGCGAPMAPDGSCPTCGMGAPDSGAGAMDPNALAALMGQGGMSQPPMGAEAIGPPGSTDTTGADGDEANLQQLLALLQMLQQQPQGGPPGGGMPPGAGGPPPPGGGGGGGNPLLAAMGQR